MYSPTEGWAVGDNGTILHWNGANWVLADSPVTSRLNAIALSSATEGWAVGDEGVILRLKGGVWSQVSQPAERYLYSIAISPGTNGTDAWAMGRNGIILRYVPAIPKVSISHIEVVQVTQDITNSVPLIAGKPTFVRVYVDCTGCVFPNLTEPNVAGVLQGYGSNGELSSSPLLPVNSSVTAYRQNWTDQRGDLKKTLNFSLSPSWAGGTITLTAQVASASKVITASFQASRPVEVVYIPVRDQNREPDSWSIQNADRFAEKLYPTDRLVYTPLPTMTWSRPYICAFKLWEDYGTCIRNDLFNRLVEWERLQAANQAVSTDSFVFGWVPTYTQSYLGVGGEAKQGSKVAFGAAGLVEAPAIFVHETGHLLGRQHTNTQAGLSDPNCSSDPRSIDPKSDWILTGTFTTPKIQDYGVDGYGFGWLLSSNDAVKDPAIVYDYMSYCGAHKPSNLWTSPWTYRQIFSQTLGIGNASSATRNLISAQSYLIASGLVFTDATAHFDPFWVLTATASIKNPPIGTAYCLDIQNEVGASLSEQCFDLAFKNSDTLESSAVDGFSLMLPYSPGATSIVLKQGATEIETRLISANKPAVTVNYPNGNEVWDATGTYTITWSAEDADGNSLTYSVLYANDGSKWLPIGTNITTTQLAVSAVELPGGINARVRVIASDGVNTSLDQSDQSFTVGMKKPEVRIVAPDQDGNIPPGTTLLLQGKAYDLEDGILNDSTLSWASSRDGNLGTGSTLLISLPQGKHTITLSATDSDGNTSTSSIKVNVGYWVYLPLIRK
jgi:hypothetical protein